MPNLLSNLRECFGFSQIIKLQVSRVLIALSEMSLILPIGVATMYKPLSSLFIIIIFISISSCTQIDLKTRTEDTKKIQQTNSASDEKLNTFQPIEKDEQQNKKIINKNSNNKLSKEIVVLFSNDNMKLSKQFINVLELATYNKDFKEVSFNINYFNDDKELEKIIEQTKKNGTIYIGPIESNYTKITNKFCDNQLIFFSFSSDSSLAKECIYLLNFFPRNELEQLFSSLGNEARVALLYPENNYGYNINILIDSVADNSKAVLVNRASYKKDLSNVRNAIKELGKYQLRKYELERQKKLLSTKNDEKSLSRLKKLQKFKTTNDYDFTHILIADYGLNLLQVAPLLPYYDIDPNVIQFMGTGVIDDENFFLEPSLEGAIFPGVEKSKRTKLLEEYLNIYDENMLRISTLPYDLVGLLNYMYSNDLNHLEAIELLNNKKIKFDGIDGKFYFKNNIIERNLQVLKISQGKAKKTNKIEN